MIPIDRALVPYKPPYVPPDEIKVNFKAADDPKNWEKVLKRVVTEAQKSPTYVKNIVNNPRGQSAFKIIGIASLIMLLIDSIKSGYTEGTRRTEHDIEKVSLNQFLTSQFGGDTLGQFTTRLKKAFNNCFGVSSIEKSYIHLRDTTFSALSEIFSNVIPIALATSAIFVQNKWIKAASAAALLLGGVKLAVTDILGFGKEDLLR